jgi:hypothetical protein
MKRVFVGLLLFMFTILSSEGQWYVRQYNVTNINQLTKPQLELSLVQTKTNLLTSASISGMGVLGWAILTYAHVAVLGSYICTGIVIGGAVFSIGYMERIGRIKSAIKRNYPSSSGSISISPAIIKNNYAHTYSSGIALTFSF